MRRPWSSKTVSPSRSVSNASAYWKPEQPPPRTPTRRPDVCTSALWDDEDFLHLLAPFSVKLITCRSPAVGSQPIFPKCSDRYALRQMPSTDDLKQRIEAAIPGSRPR